MIGKSTATLAALCTLALATPLMAQTNQLVWTNNAQSGGPATIQAFDKATGVRVKNFSGVQGNGRGIVVVGDIVYYTMTGENKIHKMSATTGGDLGVITTVPSSLSTIGWDGTAFWTSDYNGTNKAFRIALDGSLLKTITLSNASGFMDGMEWFSNMLISNRSDAGGIYDKYDLDGNLIQAGFINVGTSSTGIAYDGTDFYVGKSLNTFGRYNGSTGAFIADVVPISNNKLFEDLSFDYAQRIDVPPPITSAPEPHSLILLATGLAGMFGVTRRVRKA